ncbi:MAG: hypothetical protein AB8E15_13360 [Bdellovibrionales bacterium]
MKINGLILGLFFILQPLSLLACQNHSVSVEEQLSASSHCGSKQTSESDKSKDKCIVCEFKVCEEKLISLAQNQVISDSIGERKNSLEVSNPKIERLFLFRSWKKFSTDINIYLSKLANWQAFFSVFLN